MPYFCKQDGKRCKLGQQCAELFSLLSVCTYGQLWVICHRKPGVLTINRCVRLQTSAPLIHKDDKNVTIPCLKTVSGRRWPQRSNPLNRSQEGHWVCLRDKSDHRNSSLGLMQHAEHKHNISLPGVPTKHIASVHRCQGFWFAGVLSHRNARVTSKLSSRSPVRVLTAGRQGLQKHL